MSVTSYHELAGTLTEEIPVIDYDDQFDLQVSDDFDAAAFEQEMDELIASTAIERKWTSESGLQPFGSDAEILKAAARGQVVRVSEGVGFLAIQRQGNWTPERSDPEHPFHYSPPYLRPEGASMLRYIGHAWAREMGWGWAHKLPVTSMSRSLPYQGRLGETKGKLAIDPTTGLSTHLYGLAFDIDACGLYLSKNVSPLNYLAKDLDNIHSEADMDIYERFVAANPRMYDEDKSIVALGHTVLLEILEKLAAKELINVAEEFAGTTNNCFHVAVNPSAPAY